MPMPNFPSKFRYPYDYKSVSSAQLRSMRENSPMTPSDFEDMVARHMDRDRDLEDYLAHLSSSSSSGGGTRLPFYTVDTVGALGLGTPAPFAGTGDFHGNGATDDVAIQAAIDAAYGNGVAVNGVVMLLPGVYAISTPIDTKGVPLMGPGGPIIGGFFTAALYNVGAGRVIQNNTAGNNVKLRDLVVFQTVAAAGIYTPDISLGASVVLEDCIIQGFTNSGADPGLISCANPAGANQGSFWISNCSVVGDPAIYSGFAIQGIMYGSDINGGLVMKGPQGHQITGNLFTGGNDGIKITGFAEDNLIVGNNLQFIVKNGIHLDGSGGGNRVLGTTIVGNQMVNFDIGGTGNYDGILLENNADRNNIQGNQIRAAANGRYNINIATADCDNNFVTNNDLHDNAPSGPLNDAGTGTVTVAGNYL